VPYPSTVAQIEARTVALAAAHPTVCTRFELTHRTWEGGTVATPGRKVAYLRIGTGTGGGRPRILLNAGIHAREWAPPDAVLTFVERLLAAYKLHKAGTPKPVTYPKFVDTRPPAVTFKEFTISVPDVVMIVERTELYVLPLSNPDGRAHSMHSSKAFVGWRKNRRPPPPSTTCPPFPSTIDPADLKFLTRDPTGVDLNRNFDIAWDVNKYYSTTGRLKVGVSDDPCEFDQTYHGPTPYDPEPETKNIKSLLDDKDIQFYVDVHSAARKFLFAWGMEQNQETDPKQTFKSPAFDRTPPTAAGTGGRDALTGTTYREWMPPGTEAAHQRLGDRMVNAILDSTGYKASDEATDPIAKTARDRSRHEAIQSTGLSGAITGVSRDYAFSRQIGATTGTPVQATALSPVFSYTFECGHNDDGGFWPDATKHYPKVEREVGAALASFLTFAATWVAPVPAPTPTPTPPPPPPPPPPKGGCLDVAVPFVLLLSTAFGAAAFAAARALSELL
jgi:hypothetical protein